MRSTPGLHTRPIILIVHSRIALYATLRTLSHSHRLGGGGSSSVCHSAEDKEGKFATRFGRRGVSEGVGGSCTLACSTTLVSCIDIAENLR